jgi:DNA polymerase I
MIVCLDTETPAMRPGVQLPRIVCTTYTTIDDSWNIAPPRILDERDGVNALAGWLSDPSVHLVGAETAFDMLCPVTSAGQHPYGDGSSHLLGLVVDAYDAGRVHDVFIRQKLLDLAAGNYNFGNGCCDTHHWHPHEYNLQALSRRLCGIELDKGDDNPDHWRLRYELLRGVPFEQWPADALSYALDDAWATAHVFVAQCRADSYERRKAQEKFPGLDPLADEARQTRAALWLKAMSAYGVRTDPVAVRRYAGYVREEYERLCAYLLEHGHTDSSGVRHPLMRRELKRVRQADGAFSYTPREFKAVQAHEPTLQAAIAGGYVSCKHVRNTKVAKDLIVAAYARQGKEAPRSVQKVKGPDGRNIKKIGGVSLDKFACDGAEDPLLETYAEIGHIGKIFSADIPVLMRGAVEPIHARYDSLKETGRTGTSAPNLQNRARGFMKPCYVCDATGQVDGNPCGKCRGEAEIESAGDRECFVPRPGYIIGDCDYSQGELYTFAQICKWVLGYSTLGDILIPPDGSKGKDPHTYFAVNIARARGMSITYDEFSARKKEPLLSELRTCAKGLNFGGLGGLGPDTMAVMAYRSYKVKLSVPEWEEIFEIWHATYTELPAYFGWIKSLESFPRSREFNVPQPWSGRLRARCTFCSGANTGFQGLLADIAKLAGWYLFKACYVERQTPLYGCRPVFFGHDEFKIEIPEDGREHAAVTEQARLMNLAAREVCPDYPTFTEPALARRWSKKAEAVTADDGRLIAWEHEDFASEQDAEGEVA